ncbi:MAG: hypothetical protein AMXMBFR13_45870 [Phycisphaerae bacterium]
MGVDPLTEHEAALGRLIGMLFLHESLVADGMVNAAERGIDDECRELKESDSPAPDGLPVVTSVRPAPDLSGRQRASRSQRQAAFARLVLKLANMNLEYVRSLDKLVDDELGASGRGLDALDLADFFDMVA